MLPVPVASFAPAGGGLERPVAKALTLSPAAFAPPPRSTRFSGSAWALIRSDVSPGLATAGQLGGSQIGIRARYGLSDHVYLAARMSGPTGGGTGKEAALALDLRPLRSLPVTLTVERRLALDGGARSAFAVGVFGGFDRQIRMRTRIDGYGQAGLVGLRSRDAYVDGAIRAERELANVGLVRIGAGVGLWGGAQPDASRLDTGPQIVLHAPVGPLSVRVGAEWRQRIAGAARPGSGPVLSLGVDF